MSNTDVKYELIDASPIRSRLSPDAKGSKEKLAFWTLLEHMMEGVMVVSRRK